MFDLNRLTERGGSRLPSTTCSHWGAWTSRRGLRSRRRCRHHRLEYRSVLGGFHLPALPQSGQRRVRAGRALRGGEWPDGDHDGRFRPRRLPRCCRGARRVHQLGELDRVDAQSLRQRVRPPSGDPDRERHAQDHLGEPGWQWLPRPRGGTREQRDQRAPQHGGDRIRCRGLLRESGGGVLPDLTQCATCRCRLRR